MGRRPVDSSVAEPQPPRRSRPRRLAHFALFVVVAVAVGAAMSPPASVAAGEPEEAEDPPTECVTPEAEDEPPCNPALAGSPWGASHRGSYAQASSPFPGPVDADAAARHVSVPGVPIQLQFSAPYADGGLAVWSSLVNTVDSRAVVKLDHGTGEIIDIYLPAEREDQPPDQGVGGITGAYNMLDAEGRFIVGRQRSLEVYEDSVEGDRFSPIELAHRFGLPDAAFCGSDDVIAGATMTYDGHVAFVTERGVVGLVPRQPERMEESAIRTFSLNGPECATVASGEGDSADADAGAAAGAETVSNNLAADENGGLYAVTSTSMNRLDASAADGALELTWSAPYDVGDSASAIRLGAGSGSTPSLMGTEPDDDRFVVITDAQDLMHVVLYWRDEVPEDWEPIGAGVDPRIACRHPVTFGDPGATRSISEQSVLVRGTATVHVSDRLADESAFDGLPPTIANALAALEGGDPAQAPRGMERIDWDPATRTCRSVWSNGDVSIPNAIPTMSAASGLIYAVGQREGMWGTEGVDMSTGESILWLPARNDPCSEAGLSGIDPAQRAALEDVLARLPNSCENSTYAATEVGPDGSIYTGTFLGVSSYVPRRPPPGVEVAAVAPSDDEELDSWATPLLVGIAIGLLLVAVAANLSNRRRNTMSGDDP